MDLLLDLRLGAAVPEAPGTVAMSLDDFAARLLGEPGPVATLREVVLGRRYDTVRVVFDDRPPSAIEAGAAWLVSLARARRVEVVTGGRRRVLSPRGYRAFAFGRAVAATPVEAARTAGLLRVAERAGATPFDLPAPRGTARAVYLRSEPTIRWLGDYVGGAATHTNGVILGLQDNGVDVRVLAPERPPGTEAVPCTVVPPPRLLHFVGWASSVAHTRRFAAAAKGLSADFVYQRYALGSFAGLAVAKRLGVPLVLEFNGSEIWATEEWGGRQLRAVETLRALERRNVLDAALVVVVSEVLADQLVEWGVDRDRILVNPNGVDTDALAPARAEDPVALRARLGLPEAPTIGFIGTFGAWHGAPTLPEMAERVAAERPDARWLLIGDGAQRAEVEAEVQRRGLADRVTFTGIVGRERAVELLAASDICVSPHVPNADGSRFFGSPTKLFEYMGLGKPIVASALEQIAEVLDDGRTGILRTPGDVPAQAAAVVELLGDAAARERLGAAALADAQERWSWTAHVRRILDAVEAMRA